MTLGIITHKRQKRVGDDGSPIQRVYQWLHKMDLGPTKTLKKKEVPKMVDSFHVIKFTLRY